jgi:hypothetical protein
MELRSLKRLFHHTPNLSNNRKNMEMMYERKNNRGKIQIMGDVLALGCVFRWSSIQDNRKG